MPLPLILAALSSGGGLGAALTGMGGAGMAGGGALSSLAGPQGFLGASPFGAGGFSGTPIQSGIPSLIGQNQAMENQGLMDVLKQAVSGSGQGPLMPFTKRQNSQVQLNNQRSRSG